MKLGELIGQGGGSEVYALDERRVLKLFRAGVHPSVRDYEVGVTKIVVAAGAPAPDVLDVVEAEGRPGIIYTRYNGPTLLTCLITGEVSPEDGGAILGRLHYSLHSGRYDVALRTFHAWTLRSLHDLESRGLPLDLLGRVRELVQRLPEGEALCHGDAHPGNILMASAGPIAIDWISALKANPLVDIARQHLTLTMVAPAALRESILAKVDSSFLDTYAALSGATVPRLLADAAPYMTVMAAMRMTESTSSAAERQRLVIYIREGLGMQ